LRHEVRRSKQETKETTQNARKEDGMARNIQISETPPMLVQESNKNEDQKKKMLRKGNIDGRKA
jgi:hypothetical protein